MKKDKISTGILQALIFNIIILIIFLIIILQYIVPKYFEIDEQKNLLNNLQTQNKNLNTKGLDFNDFRILFTEDKNKSIYIKNIYIDPEKDFKGTYKSYFINNTNKSYKEFINEKIEQIKQQEDDLNKSQIKEKIAKILPYYKNNSALEGNGITDFKFINYIEDLLHRFNLKYRGSIGIGEFKLENEDKNKIIKKVKNQSEGEIYSFNLALELVGSKKSIIDFLYYIENVGIISFSNNGNDIKIFKLNTKRILKSKEGNIFKNDFFTFKHDYFYDKDNIFNNISTTINSIKLDKYIDSSLDPIAYDNNQTFIGFIKETQANEKYKINIVLKFYVKGLEKYKTLKYINDVVISYNKLKKIINQAIIYGKKNKAKLNNSAIFSLKQLEKYNNYLLSIQKDIKNLSNKKKQSTELGNIYKQAKQYNEVFKKLNISLNDDLKNISDKLYKQYQKQENGK